MRIAKTVLETSILSEYLKKIGSNILKANQDQYRAIVTLDKLSAKLKHYTPQNLGNGYKRTTIYKQQEGIVPLEKKVLDNRPKGIWLQGSVGTGKTYLMNMFYENLEIKEKRKIHFHDFMQFVYQKMHDQGHSNHKISNVADQIINESWLLCLDEFQITDVATGVIIAQLFTDLFNKGAVVITTSNRLPKELYTTGFNSVLYDPFMDYLNQRMEIVQLRSKVDYREELLKTKDKVYYKLENDQEITDFVTKISKMFYGKALQESSFKVHGRIQKVPKASEGMALYTFDELCGSGTNPMGVPDYLKLCQLYHTIIVQNIPQMTILEKNEARRFITFIDAAYENKIKLICSAETDPEKLFVISDIESPEMMHREMIGDILAETNSPNEMMKLAIFTGEDEKFAFKRAVSRLKEMQSDLYLTTPAIKEKPNEEMQSDLYLTTPAIKEKHNEEMHIPQVSDDFASEASYGTSAKKAAKDIKIRREVKIPKFQDQHFWGMSDEWGPDAGKWGEGIKGFFKSYIFRRKR